MNILDQKVHAEVANDGVVSSAHDAKLSATSSHEATTQAKSGSKGDTAVTPTIAIAVVNDEAVAQLGTGGSLSITGALDAEATEKGKTETTSEGDTTSGKTGVGVSLALTVANDNATATTRRDVSADGAVMFGAHVTASSSSEAKSSVAGDEGESGEGGSGSDAGVDNKASKELGFANTKAKEKDSTKKGTNGASSPSAETSDNTGGSGGNKISVAGAIGINIASSSASATIPDAAHVHAGDKLTLSASNNTDSTAKADGSATVAGTQTSGTGVGAAVAINVANVTTEARIGSAIVDAKGVTVEAKMGVAGEDKTNTFDTEATSGAGGGKIGVAGSFALTVATVKSDATIASGASISAGTGDLTMTAEATTASTVKALPSNGGGDGGKVGIGASVALEHPRAERDGGHGRRLGRTGRAERQARCDFRARRHRPKRRAARKARLR